MAAPVLFPRLWLKAFLSPLLWVGLNWRKTLGKTWEKRVFSNPQRKGENTKNTQAFLAR